MLGIVDARLDRRMAAEQRFRTVENAVGEFLDPTTAVDLALAYHSIGLSKESERLVAALETMTRGDRHFVGDGHWAGAYLAIEQQRKALEALERAVAKVDRHAVDAGFRILVGMKVNRWRDPVLDEPGFQALLDHIGAQ